MQSNKLVADQHYAVRRWRHEIGRYVFLRSEKRAPWSHENVAIMRQVVDRTGGPIAGPAAQHEHRIQPKDIVAPWEDYQADWEHKNAEQERQHESERLNRDAIRQALERLGFKPNADFWSYSFNAPIDVRIEADLARCRVSIRGDLLVAHTAVPETDGE